MTTACCKKFSFVFALLALAVVLRPTPASAQTCLADVDSTIAKHLGGSTCTANDVRIAKAVNPRDPLGNPITTCFAGSTFSFIADFQVVTTATNRENIGLYMRTDGITPAGSANGNAAEFPGSCVDNIISPLHWPGANTTANPTFDPNATTPPNNQPFCSSTGQVGLVQCLGTALYHENAPSDGETTGDNCGDTTSADGQNQFITVAVNGIVCPAAGTQFGLPNCTTWWQPTNNVPLCQSTPPGTGWPFNTAAQAGTTSKCNCSVVNIPITPIDYSLTVTKTPSPTTLPEPGGDFTYTVGATNTTTQGGSFSSETITQVCDDRYGNIATVSACSGGSNATKACTVAGDCPGGTCVSETPCAAGSLCPAGSQPGSSCVKSATCTLPQQLAGGATNNNLCSFVGTFSPGTEGSLKDTVTVSGFGDNGQPLPPAVTNSNNATVTVSEAPATVNVTKSLDSTRECATVRYKVEVDNTSGTSTDESESLSKFLDTKYGALTSLSAAGSNPAILGTTCGVATSSPGLGTLSASSGAGTLPASIAVGGNYTCEFDGQFCAALGTFGSCAQGLEEQNTVTATVSDDNSEGNTVTGNTSSTLTVDVCFTHTP